MKQSDRVEETAARIGSETRAASLAGSASGTAYDFLADGGELGGLMRAQDWSRTPIGQPETWPQSLRTSVSTCLNCTFPILLWWGPRLVMLYNDAYSSILGIKHPDALGSPGHLVWPEIWNVVGPMLERVMTEGVATKADDLFLPLHRRGYTEECYFSFSYSPIRDESGGMGGVFCPVIETTERVIGERRLLLLRRLAERTFGADSPVAACVAAASCLAEGGLHDLPFVAFYLLSDEAADTAWLAGSAGVQPDGVVCPAIIHLDDKDGYGWPLQAAATSGEARIVEAISAGCGVLPQGPWDAPPERVVVLPLGSGGTRPFGLMVAGLNPYRPAKEVSGFADLVAGQVATVIGHAVAYEAERRRAQVLAEIDRAKSAFFANVSHEFRTPLTLLLGPLEEALALEASELPPQLRSDLTMSRRNALRLQKLVNALLEFSRIEGGAAQANVEATDLAELTADLASGFRSAFERAGLRFEVDCPPLAAPVLVDRDMWEKVVLNLLSNAFKFTFEGGITIRLRSEGTHAVLHVEDTGVGIAAHELPRLFERFHRIEGQRSRTYEGSGIGLALVQELVRLHSGTIQVESEVGRGTRFCVRMPLTDPIVARGPSSNRQPGRHAMASLHVETFIEEALSWLSEPAGSVAQEGLERAQDGEGRARILLADDNADMRAYTARLLSAWWDVEAVADGQAALESIRVRRPDLVLTDVMMPRLDGLGLVRAIRSTPGMQDLPVIFLSARTGEEARIEGLDAGADDYVVKPFSAHELRARVRANLSLAKLRREAVQAVADSEARLQLMFQQAPGFMCMLRGPDHVFELVNEAYVRLVGPRQLIGKRVRDALPDVKGQGFFDLLDEVYRSGKAVSGRSSPLLLQRKEGEPPYSGFVDFIYQPIIDQAGSVTGIFIEGFDTTERVRAEAELQTRKSQLQAVLETVPAAVWFTYDRDARHVTGNRHAAELLRTAEDANHSMTAWEDVRPDAFRVQRDGEEVPADQLPIQRAARGERVTTEEYDLLFKDGSTTAILVRATSLRDEAGGVIGAVCTAIDITERKQAEAVLRRSEEEFRALGENQANLCWMADAAGWIYWYNKRWFDYTGTTLEAMQGWGWQSVQDPAMLATVTERWQTALSTGQVFEMTLPLRGSDGVYRPFLTRVVPVRDTAGRITRWFGSNVDISEQQATEQALRAGEDALRRLNEELEARVASEIAAREQVQERLAQAQRMEALGQLAGGIAHDFNNVLQAVSGGLALIQKRAGDPEKVRQLAGMAGDAASRGAAITGRLLSFARQGELRASPVPVLPMLQGLQEILASTLGTEITVRIDSLADLPPLMADKAQLETVLINLAVNARDAMPAGGTLTLSATVETITTERNYAGGLAPGIYVRLDVTDTGVGMDAATLARASEPFFTTKSVGQGTGLGLAMARGFAQQSGGGFDIQSAPGRGTTVTLWFPRAPGVAAADDLVQGQEIETTGIFTARVLLVDDDAMVREVLAGQLEEMGYRVTQASDGLAALQIMDGGALTDLLITDLSMPGMNGLLLIHEARQRLPELPALLLTGYANADLRFEGEEARMTTVLRKPVIENELAAGVSTLLGAFAGRPMA